MRKRRERRNQGLRQGEKGDLQLFSILDGVECLKVLGVEQVPAAEPAEIE
jgi:hypothetical protein